MVSSVQWWCGSTLAVLEDEDLTYVSEGKCVKMVPGTTVGLCWRQACHEESFEKAIPCVTLECRAGHQYPNRLLILYNRISLQLPSKDQSVNSTVLTKKDRFRVRVATRELAWKLCIASANSGVTSGGGSEREVCGLRAGHRGWLDDICWASVRISLKRFPWIGDVLFFILPPPHL